MNKEVDTAFHKRILKVYYAQNNLLFCQLGKLLIPTPTNYNETLNLFS